MRAALLTTDSLASNCAVRTILKRHADDIVLLGLSSPFNQRRGGLFKQSLRHLRRSGFGFTMFLTCNFVLPRMIGRVVPQRYTLQGQAARLGIAVTGIDDVNGNEFHELLRRLDVDLVFCVYFDQILSADTLALPASGAINAHSSLLPRHRGPMPVVYSCLDDPPAFGMTLHRIDSGIDTGPIVAQRKYQESNKPSALTLTTKLHLLGADMLEDVLNTPKAPHHAVVVQTGGSYESFPTRSVLMGLRHAGYKLCDLRDWVRALRTPVGI